MVLQLLSRFNSECNNFAKVFCLFLYWQSYGSEVPCFSPVTLTVYHEEDLI